MRINALAHFKKVDPVLYKTAQRYVIEMAEVLPAERYFERLCRAIVGQQLSTKAAATIWGRFENLLINKKIEPENILKLTPEQMRAVGLSHAKVAYVTGLAEAVVNKQIDFLGFDTLSNELIIERLVSLKGVGQWTAEMFLMFTLGRSDVFSVGDLGLKRAIERLYGLDNPSSEKLLEISAIWSPYRTYACRVLWESLDNNPKI